MKTNETTLYPDITLRYGQPIYYVENGQRIRATVQAVAGTGVKVRHCGTAAQTLSELLASDRWIDAAQIEKEAL